MFKRVEKRRRKQEKQEELGLTEEMKEVLGMHDTDSDESDASSGSNSESEEGSSGSESDVEYVNPNKRKLLEDVDDEDDDMEEEGAEEDEEEEEENDESEEETAEEEDDEEPPISVLEAMKNPVYLDSENPDIYACAVCPGKLLKNQTMEQVHRASKAHERRFTKFVEFAGNADPDTDIRDFWKTLNANPVAEEKKSISAKETDDQLSKRAQKRKAKLEALKAKREKSKKMKAKGIKRKESLKAAKIASTTKSSSDSEQPTISKPSIVKQPKGVTSEADKPPAKKRKVGESKVKEVKTKPSELTQDSSTPSLKTKEKGEKTTSGKDTVSPVPSKKEKQGVESSTKTKKPSRAFVAPSPTMNKVTEKSQQHTSKPSPLKSKMAGTKPSLKKRRRSDVS
ncbi:hypothetical protein C8Q75DRAFT_810654 [Abortiporus biennis]|nr:hypothetical protein C8Q75DRAFT_810654 [Abortiporus biennis]